jgi:hypothetical protein
MWDPDTKQVHLSRDIVWLNKMFFEKSPDWIAYDINEHPDPLNNDDVENEEIEIVFEEEPDDDHEEQSHEEIESMEDIEDVSKELNVTTKSGPQVKIPARFREELNNFFYEDSAKCSKNNDEMLLIGAGIREGILHTGELHVLKYKDAMASGDWNHWIRAIQEEHDRMVNNNV